MDTSHTTKKLSDVKFIYNDADWEDYENIRDYQSCDDKKKLNLDPEYMSSNDTEIFLKALQEGNIKLIKKYFENEEDNLSPMIQFDKIHSVQVAFYAYYHHFEEIFNLFLEKGYDPNFGHPYLGINILTQAIIYQKYSMVKKLLELKVTLQCKGSPYDLEKIEEHYCFLLCFEEKSKREEIRQWLEINGFADILVKIHSNWKTLLFGDKLLLNAIIQMDEHNLWQLLKSNVTLEHEEGDFLLKFLEEKKINQIKKWLKGNYFDRLENNNPNWQVKLFGE